MRELFAEGDARTLGRDPQACASQPQETRQRPRPQPRAHHNDRRDSVRQAGRHRVHPLLPFPVHEKVSPVQQPERPSERLRVSFPCPQVRFGRLGLKWPPLFHLRSPTAQRKLTDPYCRSSGRAIFLNSAAAQSTRPSHPSHQSLAPSEGRPRLCQQ